MKKLSFLTIATAMLLGWSSMQAQDALEVTASQAQVTQEPFIVFPYESIHALIVLPFHVYHLVFVRREWRVI